MSSYHFNHLHGEASLSETEASLPRLSNYLHGGHQT